MNNVKISTSDEIVIYPSLLKLTGLLIISILFTLCSIFLMVLGFEINIGINTKIDARYNKLLLGSIGILCFLFSVICLLYIAKRLIIEQPSLIINKEGITDNASAVGVGLLKWCDIKEIGVYYYMGQKFLGIEPMNPEEILSSIPKYKQGLLKMNRGLGTALINIPQNAIKISLEEIYTKMKEYMDQNS